MTYVASDCHIEDKVMSLVSQLIPDRLIIDSAALKGEDLLSIQPPEELFISPCSWLSWSNHCTINLEPNRVEHSPRESYSTGIGNTDEFVTWSAGSSPAVDNRV